VEAHLEKLQRSNDNDNNDDADEVSGVFDARCLDVESLPNDA
jgi:hypothetical protein